MWKNSDIGLLIAGLPEAVGKVNLVFFTPPNDFDERATALVSALNGD